MKVLLILLASYFSCHKTFAAQVKETPKAKTVELLINKGHPPFSHFGKKKVLNGVYVDIIKELSKGMKDFDIKLTPASWQKSKIYLNQGKILASLPPFYLTLKEKTSIAKTLPFFKEEISLLCNPNVKVSKKSKWPEDFNGKKIAHRWGMGWIGGREFAKLARSKKIKLYPVKKMDEAIISTMSGRNDCTLANRVEAALTIKTLIENGKYNTGELIPIKSVASYPVYIGVSPDIKKFPYRQAFITSLNEQIKKLYQSNRINDILARSFKKIGLSEQSVGYLELTKSFDYSKK